MATAQKLKRKRQLRQKKRNYTKFISVFREEVELKAFNVNKDIAKAYAEEARKAIEQQSFDWTPLSDRYREWKIQRGYDERIYIRTGEFLEAISWGVTHGRVWTGIPSRKMYTGKYERADEPDRERFPMWLLARWLEFGTTHKQTVETKEGKKVVKTVIIPPRPIWRPLLAKFMQGKPAFGKRYRKALAQAVKRRAKR